MSHSGLITRNIGRTPFLFSHEEKYPIRQGIIVAHYFKFRVSSIKTGKWLSMWIFIANFVTIISIIKIILKSTDG